MNYIAGVDEVGRGCLAGNVFAAAVILPPDLTNIGTLADSKKLSASKRTTLDAAIKQHAVAWSIAQANIDEIDRFNILQASLMAMKRAIEKLNVQPDLVQVDGRDKPHTNLRTQCIIGGDRTIACISAASIIAKVARDKYMCELDKQHPGYDFSTNKGYGTKKHLQLINTIGISSVHRKSFKPISEIINYK